MTKFHITAKGDPGICKATTRGCPLGGESEHYSTADEARTAFEVSQSGAFASVAAKRKLTPVEKVGKQIEEEAAAGKGVALIDEQGEAFSEWLDDSDRWEVGGSLRDMDAEYDQYFRRHMENEPELDGEFGDHFNEGKILAEISTDVQFYTDDSYQTSHGDSLTIWRKDIDGFDFDQIIEKHRY